MIMVLRDRYLLFHNPRTGGSSLRDYILHNHKDDVIPVRIGPHKVHPHMLAQTLIEMRPDLAELIPMTLYRNPRDRLASMWRYSLMESAVREGDTRDRNRLRRGMNLRGTAPPPPGVERDIDIWARWCIGVRWNPWPIPIGPRSIIEVGQREWRCHEQSEDRVFYYGEELVDFVWPGTRQGAAIIRTNASDYAGQRSVMESSLIAMLAEADRV